MVKKHSTSALTPEDHARQDKLYNEGHEYDYVIIGTGSSALTTAALLANQGYKICMLEAHDIPGGYAQTFRMADFQFCAQIHYIWGCAPGGVIYEFLKRVGLEKDITFELMGKIEGGYDLMALPDGKKVKIPYGFDKLVDTIEQAYPGQGEGAQRFALKLAAIRKEMRNIPVTKNVSWMNFLKAFKLPNVIKYRKATLQTLFDECKVEKEAQAILCGQAGDFMLPPAKLSIFMYAALFGGYNTGAYYPTKHFKYYVDRLIQFITEHEGCHIYYETQVNKINVEGDQCVSVETVDGKVFKGKNYICNMDPQAASNLIGRDKFSTTDLKPLSYDYSPSGVMVYLGLKGIDLRDYGFGSYNIWHMEQWDMNAMWKEQGEGDFGKPWIFMSTPTLHTDDPGNAPEGCQILEVATYAEYGPFKEFQDKGYADYNQYKLDIAVKMLDIVEKHYIPNLRDYICLQVVGSPVTNEDFCFATRGNAYGSNMTPDNVNLNRLKAKTPWNNLFWCNASSGFAGVYGTVMTGTNLYMDLTGDRFYNGETAPTDEEFIAALPLSK